MKRFKVEKAPQGGYCIVDTTHGLPIAFLEKKAPADRACKEINTNHENVAKSN